MLTKLLQQLFDPDSLADPVAGSLESPPVVVAHRHRARDHSFGL